MKKKILQIAILTIFGLFGFFSAQAQITITTGTTAQELAQMLVGQGVTMLNPQLNGQCPVEGGSSGAGKFNFNGNPSDIGIDSGIVLTSGNASNIDNPASFFSSAAFVGGAAGDADLNQVLSNNGSNSITHDACVLEFDFVPTGDTIKFDYVFGSEEYPEYDCSSFNDVFAFLISGPGLPSGLNNLALVPGTTIPVAINSINNTSFPSFSCTSMGTGSPFSQYYVDNQANGGQYVCYDGFTTVLTAISHVIACDTYHLKLAIADAGDQSFDSGVFLKAGSLHSTGAHISSTSTQGHNDFVDPHCIRGCKPGKFIFTRPSPGPLPLVIHYAVGGTAAPIVDYTPINTDSIVIPGGEDSAILEIYGLVRATPQPPKTVSIYLLSVNAGCGPVIGGQGVYDTATITIYDKLYVNITSPPSNSCPGDQISITADIDSTLNYSWSPAAGIPDPDSLTIHPSPTHTTTYIIKVTMPGTDPNVCFATDSFTANVDTPPTVVMPSPDTTICMEDSASLVVHVLPENIDYDVQWLPANFLRNDYALNNKFYAPPGNYHFWVIAKSQQSGCSDSGQMLIHVVNGAKVTWVSPGDTTIHYGDQVRLGAGGDNIKYWVWSPSTGLSDPNISNPEAAPSKSTVYSVIGISKYGCRDTAMMNINVSYNPNMGIANAFTPNGDGTNDYFKIINIRYEKILLFHIYNRLGQLVYDGSNGQQGWDGKINGQPAPMDTYYYVIKLALPLGKIQTYKGTVTLLR